MTDVSSPRGGSGLPPGTRLNGIYEIERLIAEGGMGEVYKARNIETGDPVAVKLILEEFARNDDALALFRREASLLHTLHHEAIVRYFVFTVEPTLKRPYLAMEFVDGPSLGDVQAKAPLSVADVRRLQERLAGGLAVAHERGIVHRDLSPDNVILPDGDVRQARIIDFGIARWTRPGAATIIGGQFAGKYNYVSPEQLGLFGGAVDARSDIYSLGLLLAGALLGRPLDMDGSQFEVVEKRRSVPDLSAIDPSMRPLLAAMLAPDPADRPRSMADVARWVPERGVEGAGRSADRAPARPAPRAARPSALKSKEAPSRSGGGIAVAAVAALVMAAGGLGYAGWRLGWFSGGDAQVAALDLRPDGDQEHPEPPAEERPDVVERPGPEPISPVEEPPPVAEAPPPPPVEEAPPVAETPPLPPVEEAPPAAPPVEPGLALTEPSEPAPPPTEPSVGKQMPPDQIADILAGGLPDSNGPPAGTSPPPAGEGGFAADDIRDRILEALAREGLLGRPDDAPRRTPPAPPANATVDPDAAPPVPDGEVDVTLRAGTDAPRAANLPPAFTAADGRLPPAGLGRSYVASLPRVVDPEGGRVTITVDGDPPPGLSVFWKPDGSVQVSGLATIAGRYAFGIVARDAAGAATRLPVEIEVVAGDDNPIRFVPQEEAPSSVATAPAPASEPPTPETPATVAPVAPAPVAALDLRPTGDRIDAPDPGGADDPPAAEDHAPRVTEPVAPPSPPPEPVAIASPPPEPVSPPPPDPATEASPPPAAGLDLRPAGERVDPPVVDPSADAPPAPEPVAPVVEPAPVADPPPAAPVVAPVPAAPDPAPPVDVAAVPPSGGTLELVLPGAGNSPAPPPSVEGFLSGFDGGDCFFARPLVADAGAAHIEGFGAAVEGFQRLESSYMKDFSSEPQIDVRLVSAAQCPAVAFLDALGAGRLGRSLITLESYSVGGAVPLSGRITGVEGRSLSVLLVGDDGTVARLDPYLERTADGARFSIPLQADGASDGVPQLLIALVTDAPINGLPDSGPAAALFADLSRAFAGAAEGVSADAAMFKVGGR